MDILGYHQSCNQQRQIKLVMWILRTISFSETILNPGILYISKRVLFKIPSWEKSCFITPFENHSMELFIFHTDDLGFLLAIDSNISFPKLSLFSTKVERPSCLHHKWAIRCDQIKSHDNFAMGISDVFTVLLMLRQIIVLWNQTTG